MKTGGVLMNPEKFGKMVVPLFGLSKAKMSKKELFSALADAAVNRLLVAKGIVSKEDLQAAFLSELIENGVAGVKGLEAPNFVTLSTKGRIKFGKVLLAKMENGTVKLVRKGGGGDERISKMALVGSARLCWMDVDYGVGCKSIPFDFSMDSQNSRIARRKRSSQF